MVPRHFGGRPKCLPYPYDRIAAPTEDMEPGRGTLDHLPMLCKAESEDPDVSREKKSDGESGWVLV